MASTARLGLKLLTGWHLTKSVRSVGMASTARLGLKQANARSLTVSVSRRNGLYSPFGIETILPPPPTRVGMASTARLGLKHIETGGLAMVHRVGMASTARLGLKHKQVYAVPRWTPGRNGLYSPFGIETGLRPIVSNMHIDVGMASTARWGLKARCNVEGTAAL